MGVRHFFPIHFYDNAIPARGVAHLREAIIALRRIRPDICLLVEVTSANEADAACEAGADGLIANGNETGGSVGDETCFVLLQRLLAKHVLPVWARGGIGEHTIGACAVAGAAGVVLDSQLALTREAHCDQSLRETIARMDGSETVVLGTDVNWPTRLREQPASHTLKHLRALEMDLANSSPTVQAATIRWRAALREGVRDSDPGRRIWLCGQDAAYAQNLADRFVTVGGVLQALRQAADRHIEAARSLKPLNEGAPLAATHHTRYPVVQGPMTRVSDQPKFASAIADAGGLPFLAFALMQENEAATLLRQTRKLLGRRPFGAGILGFVPTSLRQQQLAALKAEPPPFAIVAGGSAAQATELEANGIATYLHAPSPGILRLFLDKGVRKFVFEGRECGGHVGPRSSFVLWNQMVDVLLNTLPSADLASCRILFAGGIHDALSAAMVATIAAPLAQANAQIGVLMGTAYLFTDEAVDTGAILETFRQEAVKCQRTVLLESGPGHATRCAPTGFAEEFRRLRRHYKAQGTSSQHLRDELERINIGRLRIASKGLTRSNDANCSPSTGGLTSLPTERQRAEGLYMLGQVAALRGQRCTVTELHRDVCVGGTDHIEKIVALAVPRISSGRKQGPMDIAIIGMSCLLPGAPDLESYWKNILSKVDAITEVPAERWDWRKYFDPDRSAPDRIYSKWGGFLAEHPFDPVRYGMPPTAMRSIDPFQLLTLEAVRAALADAGYLDRAFDRTKASVVLGIGGGSGDLGQHYALRSAIPQFFDEVPKKVLDRLPDWTEDSFAGILLNVAAGRVANRFNFQGVNYTVDAACASSLAAVYLASTELELGTSDIVLVGGVDTVQNPFGYLCFSKTQALSPRGKCRPFDASADGIVISEGLAFAVLKRLADAERDGDRVYAVIKAIAGSSDGRDKGLTAPRSEGQALALERAYARADFGPETVGLIEAHGTGTVAGDKVEIETLKRFLKAAGATPHSCALGSVKSMIGHTKCAAGLAGVIKATMALYHRVLPATINVDQPNTALSNSDSPLYVNTETRPWLASSNRPRRAGVSSFGFGGTNFTAVLEEYSDDFLELDDRPATPVWSSELLLWRAAAPAALAAELVRLERMLAAGAEPRLRDLAATLWHCARDREGVTLAIIAQSLSDLRSKLEVAQTLLRDGSPAAFRAGVYYAAVPLASAGKLAFLFPGQGSQSINMLRELALHFSEVRSAFELAQSVLAGRLPYPFGPIVFPFPCFDDKERTTQAATLIRTDIAQPAIGAACMGLTRLLARLGIFPDMAAGHSYGELPALCCAGTFDEAALYRLSEARGRAILDSIPGDPGTMAAVMADRSKTERALSGVGDVWIANINAPGQIVISGSRDGITAALDRLRAQGVSVRPLSVAYAFHSPIIKDAGNRLAAALLQQPLSPPRLPVYSNVSAAAVPREPSAISTLLCDQIVSPVRFQEQIEAMHRDGARIFIEVGPRDVLTSLVGSILRGLPYLAVAVDSPGHGGIGQLQQATGQLAAHGVRVNLDRLFLSRDCKLLNMDSLVEDTRRKPLPSTTWMVNGGRARPLRDPPIQASGFAPAKPGAIGVNRNGLRAGARTMPIDSDPKCVVVNSADPVAALPGRPLSAPRQNALLLTDDAAHVVSQFQQVMERFLETQQSVMQAYLAGAVTGTATDITVPFGALAESEAQPKQLAREAPAEPRRAVSVASALQRTPPQPNSHTSPVLPPAVEIFVPESAPSPDLMSILLRIVSERTGYPKEMLGLDLDMEADLGIDSIKRVEIMAGFHRAVHGENDSPNRQIPDSATEIKTLSGMLEAVSRSEETPTPPFAQQPTLEAS
jgi:acyl transferase domain-containing protein/NAD(P)H-dependent flavin oxidoreductase YrpB (nitropropane dioxygenase family)